MNALSHHHTSKDKDSTNYSPIAWAVGIVVVGVCAGYLAVRCFDRSPAPAAAASQADRHRSGRSSRGDASSRVHDLQLHAQSPFDGVVDDDDDDEEEEESEEEEYSEEEDIDRKARPG